MSADNIIEINDLNKSFEGYTLFHDFNLSVKRNSIHGLIGPNGSGKTTLLRILTGLYKADAGEIIVKEDHAILLENDYLYEEKTGRENIKIFSMYFKYSPNDYRYYADLLHLTDHLEKRVSTYSKGMKRKLSLLIVILMNREILFLDEVTSGVDPISRVEIRKIIKELKSEGKTVVLTSHDLSEIEKTADHISMIDEGELILNMSGDEFKENSLEEIFIKAGKEHEKSE